MSVLTLPWFEEEDPRDLRRWAIAAAIVFGIHAAAVGGYAFFHRPTKSATRTRRSQSISPLPTTPSISLKSRRCRRSSRSRSKNRRRLPSHRRRSWRRRTSRRRSRSRRENRRRRPFRRESKAARCASNRHGRPRWCGTFSNTSAIQATRNRAARKAWCN